MRRGMSLWFWFAFPKTLPLAMLSIFSCVYWKFVYFVWINVYWNSLLIFIFANIFFHSIGFVLTVLVILLTALKFLILRKLNLFIFPFVACVFDVIYKKQLPNPKCWRFIHIISSKSFMVSGLMFSSIICLHIMWGGSPASFFGVWIFSCPSAVSWFNCSFPIELSWHICQKSIDHKCKGFIYGLWTLFHWSVYLSLCQYHTVLNPAAL